jgi:hypothetical protein
MVEDGTSWDFPGRAGVAAVTAPRLGGMLVVTLAAADIVLTLVGIQTGLQEENPVASRTLATFGAPGLVALKGLALGLLAVVVWQLPIRYGRAAIGGFCLTQLVAVCWNTVLVITQVTV